ncbi:lipopolysaccharide biosynthesis protein [Cupriavidus oxalaticus]|uniref:Lipopolysaccharide biosynthesis protein n=1 Tax=Cupriavidus oxalaticus TaxID=96344 RepID=A0A4P7LMM2_9BURK|nr:oligosaccharide flippase family protein [Cupriavidus oxalaticus]QBY54017.1 lipopolysaccharide biosynthesis protein [Cupriavidus oxalaticus]
MRRQIARNVVWLLAERGVQVSASIGTIAMIARSIGPEGFAHFQYAQTLVLLASSIALICGAEVVVPRLVANTSTAARHQLLVHAYAVREGAAITAYVLMLAAIWISGQDEITRHVAMILGISILLREPFGVVNAWMQARTDNRAGVIFSLTALTTRLGIVGLLFLTQVNTVHEYAWAFAAESVILALLLASYYLKASPPLRIAPDFTLISQLFRDGAIFWVGFMLMMSARRVDQLLLKPQVPLPDLAAYAACMQVLDNFVLLATIVANTLAPLMIYAQPTFERLRANLVRITLGMAAIGTVGGTLIAVVAPWIVHLLYGSEFGTAVGLLRTAALASGLVFADVALSLLVVHLRKPGWLAIKWLIVVITIALVDWIMIPRHGTYGAVVGYIAGNSVALLVGAAMLVMSGRLMPEEISP